VERLGVAIPLAVVLVFEGLVRAEEAGGSDYFAGRSFLAFLTIVRVLLRAFCAVLAAPDASRVFPAHDELVEIFPVRLGVFVLVLILEILLPIVGLGHVVAVVSFEAGRARLVVEGDFIRAVVDLVVLIFVAVFTLDLPDVELVMLTDPPLGYGFRLVRTPAEVIDRIESACIVRIFLEVQSGTTVIRELACANAALVLAVSASDRELAVTVTVEVEIDGHRIEVVLKPMRVIDHVRGFHDNVLVGVVAPADEVVGRRPVALPAVGVAPVFIVSIIRAGPVPLPAEVGAHGAVRSVAVAITAILADLAAVVEVALRAPDRFHRVVIVAGPGSGRGGLVVEALDPLVLLLIPLGLRLGPREEEAFVVVGVRDVAGVDESEGLGALDVLLLDPGAIVLRVRAHVLEGRDVVAPLPGVLVRPHV
jgi:hypothetical protein